MSKYYKYVIVGYGSSGQEAAHILSNRNDARSKVLIIDPTERANMNQNHDIDSIRSRVVDIDIIKKRLQLSDESIIIYEKCLLATGSLAQVIESSKFIAPDSNQSYFYDISNPSDRQQLLRIVSKGQHITIVGASDWGSISFACTLAREAAKYGYYGSISFVTPTPGLMYSVLPKYLSISISKSLAAFGVDIIPYSQVRYIANSFNKVSDSNLFLFTGTTYDSIKTNSIDTDAVVFSPSVGVPTPTISDTTSSSSLRWQQRWIETIEKAGLEINKDRTGIVVNRSLECARDIYAAGDLACSYSPHMGRGVYTGDIQAKATGREVAYHMLGDGHIADEMPVYHAECHEIGVNMMMIGHCTTAYETHGFWWKPKAIIKPSPSAIKKTSPDSKVVNDHHMPSWSWSSPSTRHPITPTISSSHRIKRGKDRVVYGDNIYKNSTYTSLQEDRIPPTGIVFYVDGADIIQGVLISGCINDDKDQVIVKKKLAEALIGSSIDRLSVDTSSNISVNRILRPIYATTRQTIEYMTTIADKLLYQLQSANFDPHQNMIISTSPPSSMPTSQYKFTAASPSSNKHYSNDTSSKNIYLRSQHENIFFNTPVNISQADRMSANFVRGIHDSMKP